MRDFWVHRYQLTSATVLNAASTRREFPGALIRVDGGFGCLHPWPELGDPSLDDCLAHLAAGRGTPLVDRALACVQIDAEARATGHSLFKKVTVPLSHATLPQLERGLLEKATAAGFTTVKLKSPDLASLRSHLAAHPALRFRIDFNSTADPRALTEAFSQWTAEEKARLDFLEDPVPFQKESWQELRATLGIPLANDRESASDSTSEFLVLKPALDDFRAFAARPARKIITSYMDHPLGQSFAAYEAGRSAIEEICGLQTHGLFEKDAFIERLGPVAPRFTVPQGSGLGFDDLLEALPWKRL